MGHSREQIVPPEWLSYLYSLVKDINNITYLEYIITLLTNEKLNYFRPLNNEDFYNTTNLGINIPKNTTMIEDRHEPKNNEDINMFNEILDKYYDVCKYNKFPNSMIVALLYPHVIKNANNESDKLKKILGNFTTAATLTKRIHSFIDLHNTKYEIRKNPQGESLKDRNKALIIFKKN